MKKASFLATLVFVSSAYAYEAQITKGELAPTLGAMIARANKDTNLNFKSKDFILVEERQLATSQFQMYVQANSSIPVDKTAIRIWSHLKTKELLLGEMHLNEVAQRNTKKLSLNFQKGKFSLQALKSKKLSQFISKLVQGKISSHPTDQRILGMKFKDVWINGDLVRKVEIRGRRGVHSIAVSLMKNEVIDHSYSEFPQGDTFQTLKAHVYPIYEEVEATGEQLPYELKDLKYVSSLIPDGGENPLGTLDQIHFTESMYQPILADTIEGQAAGYWSETSVRGMVEKLVAKFPLRNNDFMSGLLLQGKFTTISLHPSVKEAFKDIQFPLNPSTYHMLSWTQNEAGQYEAHPIVGFSGKVIESSDELLAKLPVRLADHDPTSYINAGFDEIQVYYAVTSLMEALGEMGFEDPELSVKPFHAFLYDPDISMKDNAYYYDNTINFTTYSPKAGNAARDNTTIWHELGHGVMDRLMGPLLSFAGSNGYGGLSEGMADFVAKLVIAHQTNGVSFPGQDSLRILNNVGFYLTNEYHDDGEAYGGAMGDMLDDSIRLQGREGLYDFSDLTLETMRLTRNHPALSPLGWFEHMIYADELGSDVREPKQFKNLIIKAMAKRNFSFDKNFKPATMTVTYNDTVLTSSSEASRDRPLTPCGPDGFVEYNLKVSLNSGDAKFITFPATVKVEFKNWALQGAIKWEGEENNPIVYQIQDENDILNIPLKASMECESINQPDGSCKDYAYVQIYNEGDVKPRAKKRFYLKIKDKEVCE